MGKSKKTTTNTSQTQTNAPPSWTQEGLGLGGALTSNALKEVQTQPRYTGDFVAQFDPQLLQSGVDAYKGAAGTSADMQAFTQSLLPMLQQQAQAGTYDLGATADTSGVVRNAIDPVRRTLMEEILPGIKSSSLASGAYSGDRATALLPQTAVRNAVESMDKIATDITYKDYQDREARRLAAYQTDQTNALNAYGLNTQRLGLAPEMTDSVMRYAASQGDLIQQALGLQTAGDQASIDNALARDQYNLEAPFRGLDIAGNLLTQFSGNYGTMTGSSNSTTTEKSGGLGNILQGVLGAASLAAGLGAFGPLGAAASAASKFTPAASVFGRAGTSAVAGLAG